jgi:hypothetical protein
VKALALLLLAPVFACAQAPAVPTCWPAEVGGTATQGGLGITANGAFVWWRCPDARLHYLVRDLSLSFSSVGGRFDTVMNAADKQAAAVASWKRNVTLPGSDPRFSAICKDLAASIAERGLVAKACQ